MVRIFCPLVTRVFYVDMKPFQLTCLTCVIFFACLCIDDDLAFAEDGGQQQGEIQIEFQYDNDKAAKRAKEKEAMKKRQQNAVPSWHAWSTVSGEMTALGAEAAKRDLLVDDPKADGEGEVLENDLDGDDCKSHACSYASQPKACVLCSDNSFFIFINPSRLQTIL